MFDYIVVGGGSAGSVLAGRLSEDPALRVALIEAGPADRSVLIHCPAGLALLAVWGWVRWRTRQLRRREAELQALVGQRTAELREASLTDALTGLRNRRYLAGQIPADIAFYDREALRHGGNGLPLCALLVDIDHFKAVNDNHGHQAGDRVIQQFAQVLSGLVRSGDYMARWGGEEFLVVCRDSDAAQARQLAERLLQRVREHAFPGPRQLTASAGVAVLRAGDDVASLVQRADEALYDAKHAGRDRVGPCQGACAAPGERVESL